MPASRTITSTLVKYCGWCAVLGATTLVALLLLVSLLYASAPVYTFAETRPFTGARWYNPYGDLPGAGRWQKASFHAHSVAWGGATNGDQSAEQVANAYAAMRYDIVSVSNYHSMSAAVRTNTFPVYEHGWNVQKSHRLAIGGDGVVWRDYPLGQSVHHKQDIINRIAQTGAVVVLAHPALRDGHSVSDLRQLSGYDALEVLNRFVPPATTEWDAALSTGRAVWAVASDDSHDVDGVDETGVNWTLVHAASHETAAVRTAIRSGRTIGVHGVRGTAQLTFVAQRMIGDTLEVLVSGPVGRVAFFGQQGAPRAALRRDSLGVTIARAVASTNDGYLRATVFGSSAAAEEMLVLNPVVRWDGRSTGAGLASVNGTRTAAFRWIACCLYAAALTSLYAQRRRRQPRGRPVPA